MPKYTIVYKGAAPDMSEMTPEQMQEIMGKWATWMQNVGPALSDVGTPFGPGTSVVDDGSSGSSASLTGYSVLEAGDIAEAQALVKDHPFLSEGQGSYAIDIFEQMPVPGM